MGSVLSDIDFMDIADMWENRASLMPFTVSLTGCRSIASCIESVLSPTVSKYMLATAAFNNSRSKWNPFRYPRSCLSLRVSLMKRSRALSDIGSLVGLLIVLLSKQSSLWIPRDYPPLHSFRILSQSSRRILVCLLSQVYLLHSSVSFSLHI